MNSPTKNTHILNKIERRSATKDSYNFQRGTI